MTEFDERIFKWVTEGGWFRKEIRDQKFLDRGKLRRALVIQFPPVKSAPMLEVQFPREQPDFVVVIGKTSLHPQHKTMWQNLSKEEREELLWQIRTLLNQHLPDFQLVQKGSLFEAFAVMFPLYEDGLSKNAFFQALRSVHRANLAAISILLRKLGPVKQGSTPAQDSDVFFT